MPTTSSVNENNAKHTPGPWRWMTAETLVGDHGRRPVVLTTTPLGGLATGGNDGLLGRLSAEHPNARLIAAAPDLLKTTRAAWHTLQSILAVRDGIPDDSLRATADALLAAIAKAEGPQ